MARPKKQTVDYFPHYVNASKTLRIVQTQHGNDGYAFWFKLLQLLGRTEGHAYDYNDPAAWLDLLTETHVPPAKAEQILETFATLGMIDNELWQKKVIWVQHFVDEHAALYARRRVDLPVRPGDSLPEPARTIKEDAPTIAAMIEYYVEQVGKTLTPMNLEKLKDFVDTYPDSWFNKAVDEAVKNKARSPMAYIGRILERWSEKEEPAVEPTGDSEGIRSI